MSDTCPHCGRAAPTLEGAEALLRDALRASFRAAPFTAAEAFARAEAEAASAAGAGRDVPPLQAALERVRCTNARKLGRALSRIATPICRENGGTVWVLN